MTASDPVQSAGPAALLQLAENLASAAGRLVVGERRRAVPVAEAKSTPTDPVTAVDRASERLIRATLAVRRPNDAVLGEEDAPSDGSSGITWVVDPIDGTVNFLYGLPEFAISIAAAVGNVVVAATVHNPVSGETWSATRAGGAYLDGRPIFASTTGKLSSALVATGFAYDAAERGRQARELAELMPHVRDVRRMGAAALDLCNVACGRVDAYFERGIKAWDCAAGLLIAAEAGAAVTSDWHRSGPGRTCFAAAPGISDDLALLVGVDADRIARSAPPLGGGS